MSGRDSSRARATPREILEARARILARPVVSTSAASQASAVDMLSFSIGRERFAIESQYVFAVFRLTELVPLPGARAPVVGLTRWRGDVLTMLDLRRLVGVAAGALDDLGRVIVVGQSAPEFGVLADAVDEIVSIDPTQLHGLPVERKADGGTLVRGVTQDAIHVLDVAGLIARQTESLVFSPAPSAVPPSHVSTQ